MNNENDATTQKVIVYKQESESGVAQIAKIIFCTYFCNILWKYFPICSDLMNNEKDAIIEKLVEDMKNLTLEVKILKDTASQTNSVRNEKKFKIEENGENVPNANNDSSEVLNDDSTVEIEVKDSINKDHQQHNEMKKVKSKKNGKKVKKL